MVYKVETKGVGKIYFDQRSGEHLLALEKVNLTIDDGEFFCIVGPSGCGKTTLLRIIAGLEEASIGETLIDGLPIHGPGAHCGMVFEGSSLFPWRTVQGNVGFGLEFKELTMGEQQQRITKYVDLVGLSGFQQKYPHELSEGMRQRVGIARALANDPQVLLMDDPFGSLDFQTRLVMRQELYKIWKKTQKTVVFVTHYVEEAISLANRIAVFSAHPGTIKELFTITSPKERNRFSPPFMSIRKSILDILEKEVQRSFSAKFPDSQDK